MLSLPKMLAGATPENTGGIPCPVCRTGTRITDSRPGESSIRRRRVCVGCGHRFTTFEVEVPTAIESRAARTALKEALELCDVVATIRARLTTLSGAMDTIEALK